MVPDLKWMHPRRSVPEKRSFPGRSHEPEPINQSDLYLVQKEETLKKDGSLSQLPLFQVSVKEILGIGA